MYIYRGSRSSRKTSINRPRKIRRRERNGGGDVVRFSLSLSARKYR